MPDNMGAGSSTNGPTPSITLDSVRASNDRHIVDLNAQRPKPTLEHVPTPEGPVVQEVKTIESIRENARIDRQIAKFSYQRKHHRQKLKDDFDRSR